MQIKLKIILLLTVVLLLFGGCTSSSVALSDRAIVKMIYLDYENNTYTAGIAIYNFEPNADTAEIKSTAKVYLGTGQSIGEAIKAAEEKQNKNPFYAHNEILLINLAATSKINEILTYFAREEFSRPNTAVFLCDMDSESISKQQDMVSFIESISAIIENKDKTFEYSTMVYQCNFTGESGFNGHLPLLLNKENKVTTDELVFFKNGQLSTIINKQDTAMVLLLQNKAICYHVTGKDEKNGFYECDINNLQKKVQITHNKNAPDCLKLIIGGNVRNLTFEQTLQSADIKTKKRIENILNAELQLKAQQIIEQTNNITNGDIYGINWWLQLLEDDEFLQKYNGNEIEIEFDIKIL